MRKEIDNVEIQEPPIQELKKNRSCLRQSCITSCGCFSVFLVIFFLILHFTSPPRPKELKSIPGNFPDSVPIYDKENLEKITFISGQEKNQKLEWLAYIPKAILIPVYLATQNYLPDEFQSANNRINEKNNWWQNYTSLVQKPITKQKDTFELEWRDLTADPDFVEEYYRTEFGKNNFDVTVTTENKTIRQLTFKLDKIEGVLFIKDQNNKDGTDQTVLTVTVPK